MWLFQCVFKGHLLKLQLERKAGFKNGLDHCIYKVGGSEESTQERGVHPDPQASGAMGSRVPMIFVALLTIEWMC